jgi:hypothetical protein
MVAQPGSRLIRAHMAVLGLLLAANDLATVLRASIRSRVIALIFRF